MQPRLIAVALMFVALPALAAGCAFDSGIAVQFNGASPLVVTESFKPSQNPHGVQGTTRRAGQVVGIDCSLTIVYTVDEAAGLAVLAQGYLVHLHTNTLPQGTAYELDCTGPLIVELPTDASGVRATATDASGRQVALAVHAPVTAVALAFGKRLRAEPRTQFAIVRWPRTLSAGDYEVELAFSLPEARPILEKALYAASVSCGNSRYLQPILPLVADMKQAPAFTIRPSPNASTFQVPRIAGANGIRATATRTLSCAR
jgi:hypothetical protein